MNVAYEEALRLHSTYGWNVIPMYYFRRDPDGSKKHKLIDWQEYKSIPFDLSTWTTDYKNLALITGKISDLSILDIDSEEAKESIEDQLGMSLLDLSEFIVKTTKGYQLFYKYQPNTKTRIGIKHKIDFLSGGISFASSVNDGYTIIKEGEPSNLPEELKYIIIDAQDETYNEEAKRFEDVLRENSNLPYKYPLIDLVDEFLTSSRISKKLRESLEKVFCTKDFKNYSLKSFSSDGQKHNAFLYVGAIVASNPTVEEDKVIQFMEKWSEKVMYIELSSPKEQELFRLRLKGIMKYFRFNPEWRQRHKELSNLSVQQMNYDFKSWYNPEDDQYYFYDLSTKMIDVFSRPSFKEQVSHFMTKKGLEVAPSDVDTSAVDRIRETFDPTVDDEFFTDNRGIQFHNNFKRSELLSYFIACEPQERLPYYIGKLLEHLIPVKYEREIFLHSLAYHMTYLQPAPTCYIFTSIQGTGKNTLLEVILGEIYKDNYLRTEETSLVGRFRDSLKNKLCVFIDEVRPSNSGNAERGSLYSVLKLIVANKTLQIESKGKDEKTYPNHGFYVLASNEEIPLKISDESDRRINIIKASSKKLEDLEWVPKDLSKDEFDDLLRSELKDFVAYLASIKLDHRKWNLLINNEARKILLRDSVPAALRYTNALISLDVENLIELNHDFGDFVEKQIVAVNRSFITVKELKDHLGELSSKVGKKLRDAGIIYDMKKINGVATRVFIINPEGSKSPFQPISVEGI